MLSRSAGNTARRGLVHNFGVNELLGSCLTGGSSAVIDVLYVSRKKCSLFWISNSRAVVPEASRTGRRFPVSESEVKTQTLDSIEARIRWQRLLCDVQSDVEDPAGIS